MATDNLGGRASPVTFPNQLSPKDALLALLSGVTTIEQSDAWTDDYRACQHMLTRDEQIEMAAAAAVARFHALGREE